MATRTRKTEVKADIELEGTEEAPQVEESTKKRYMSHNGHGHAQKGEAGKAARAACRRAHRAWFAAEAEWLASLEPPTGDTPRKVAV